LTSTAQYLGKSIGEQESHFAKSGTRSGRGLNTKGGGGGHVGLTSNNFPPVDTNVPGKNRQDLT